jgi:alpha-D-xyloside xylohydrolase
MQEAHESGTPIMRALFYEFPQDKPCWEIKDEYMYGENILVAPVCYKNAVSRSVYLPAGEEWVLAQNGKRYVGGQSVEVEAPLETLPVFLRDGKEEYLTGII